MTQNVMCRDLYVKVKEAAAIKQTSVKGVCVENTAMLV